MRRVLITGGFGFVGSALLRSLERRLEFDITVLDNLMSGEYLKAFDNTHFIHGDIRDKELVKAIVPRYDTIIHLAAIVGEPACVINTLFSFDVNVEGTRNILQVMKKDQHIIFTSTSSVYGNRPNELVTEESEPIPINNYAQHKYLSEQDVIAHGNYTILRPVTAFGITQRTRLDLLVNTLIYEALSFGKIEVFEPDIMRPIIHVIDFANILIYALDGQLGNSIYNIGDPWYTMTKLQLAKEIANLCGAKVVEKDGSSLDPRNYDVSFRKLLDTGFRFGTNRLNLAVSQIKSVQYKISENPQSFSTPYKVKLFLERRGV